MKTSELKEIAAENGARVEETLDGHLMITSNNKSSNYMISGYETYATVSNEDPKSFWISNSVALGDDLVDAIIDYARTPIEEREEQYLNVDIPLSDWQEIAKGFDCESTRLDNKATAIFKGEDGIDSFFKVIETIQAKYVEHVGYEASYDEIERKNTSH